ncbi:hypothetical protein BOW37_12745 [Solemya velum gill symbiont]|nr:hypothetical protein BOW37_12745 [Solemya velum gill symbiont]
MTVHKVVTICSVYLPPKQQLQLSDLDMLVSQLPSPQLLLGDINGANKLWGSASNNSCGNLIDFGLKGRSPVFIQNFFNDRHFRVCLGYTLSDTGGGCTAR